MVGFDDFVLKDVPPQSPSKTPQKKKPRKDDNSDPKSPLLPPAHGDKRLGSGGKDGNGAGVARKKNLAASLQPWECDVYDYTDSVLLLTTTKDSAVMVKLQSDPQKTNVAHEMANEAAIYEALEGNEAVKEVIPCFSGYSTHLGVAMTCIEKDLDDFDDIGLENLSDALKLCAVRAVEVLSAAGVLHNDIALRNFVKCKNRAKIIDFGRASFSGDRNRLARQIETVKTLLNTENVVDT